MLWNFIKIGWRHLSKNPLVFFIQVAGLTIGLTIFLLISLWVNNQLSFDKFHTHKDELYRLELLRPEGLKVDFTLATGLYVKEQVAEVVNIARIRRLNLGATILFSASGDMALTDEVSVNKTYYADSTFFKLFTFQFIYGGAENALIDPNSVVIIESLAEKMFKGKNPMGKRINMDGNLLTISGVIKDVNNFHIPIEAVGSLSTLKNLYKNANIDWDSWSFPMHPTYLQLAQNSNPDETAQKISDAMVDIWKANNPSYEDEITADFKLRKVEDIYLQGEYKANREYTLNGDVKLITGLLLIAFLILALACVNFVNMNTTRTILRSKEVGIRKISGSTPVNVFIQFCGEIITICIFALLLALGLMYLTLPYFNSLVLTQLSLSELLNTYSLIAIIGSFLFLVIFAGVLPSWSLSAFKPTVMLKNMRLQSSKKGDLLRRFLLGLQYAITIIVLASTLMVHKQVYFLKNSDPGFSMKDVLRVSYPYAQNKNKVDVYRERLLQHPDVQKVSFGHSIPSFNYGDFPHGAEFIMDGKKFHAIVKPIYPESFDFLEIPLVQGRGFSANIKADKLSGENNVSRLILNETAVREFGLNNPVGKYGTWGKQKVEIIGVVKDFHPNTIKGPIPPLVFGYAPMTYNLMVKFTSGKQNEVQRYIAQVSKEILDSNKRSEINLLEDIYFKNYRSEEQIGRIFFWFSILSIIIAALGLYGISINAIQRRIKEIGIRKAIGASSLSILTQLQLYFVKIIFSAGIIALPIAWYLCWMWLNKYPFKTTMSWWIFAGSYILAIFIALVTISWKTWTAANSNPVKAIQYE